MRDDSFCVTRWLATLFVAVVAIAASVLAQPHSVSAGEVGHDRVVSTDPVGFTPHVLDGRVNAIASIGDTVIAGGEFSAVREPDSNMSIRRHNIFAFDARTGEILHTFQPRINGPVRALAPGPGGTVVVGGSFTAVNAAPQRGITRLRVSDGSRVRSFAGASLGDGYVRDLAVHGKWLYIGGRFSRVNGVDRTALARLDVRTGAVDPGFDMGIANPRSGALKVQKLALSPDGAHLVIDGTFTQVAGKPRYQIALIDTGPPPARLADWATDAYTAPCSSSFDTYMREIDFSPDGSYFVVVTTGGAPGPQRLCDSAARWEADATGNAIQPTWVNRTGGDTLLSVSVTGAAVYVGGHQRWMNNPYGHQYAGPGAVPRKGIAALDPDSGEALKWNPSHGRGHGVAALVATPSGLYVGSDTDRMGHEYHGKIGKFPLTR